MRNPLKEVRSPGDRLSQILYDKTEDVGKQYAVLLTLLNHHILRYPLMAFGYIPKFFP